MFAFLDVDYFVYISLVEWFISNSITADKIFKI